jgi:hypothetical protein
MGAGAGENGTRYGRAHSQKLGFLSRTNTIEMRAFCLR